MLALLERYKPDLWCSFLFLSLLLIFFQPAIFKDQVFVTVGVVKSDLMGLNYPTRDLYAEYLKQGRLPFWTNLTGNGYPPLAEGQIGALYPLNLLLYYLFPVRLAYNLYIFIHLLLAGLFLYLYTRLSLKLSSPAALFSALAFSLSGFFMIHFSHPNMLAVVTYFPLQVILVERLTKKPTRGCLFLLASTFSLQLLAGHFEMTYYSGFILAGYFICQLLLNLLERGKINLLMALKLVALFFLALGLGFLVAAPQIFSSYEYMLQSIRLGGLSYEEATSWIYPIYALKTFITPWQFNFSRDVVTVFDKTGMGTENIWEYYSYFGLLPLLFSFFGLRYKKASKKSLIFLSFALFAFMLVLGRKTPIFYLVWKIVPGMSIFRYPTRFLFASIFFLTLLAGLGFEFVNEKKESLLKSKGLVSYGTFLFIGFTFFDLLLNQSRINPLVDRAAWFVEPGAVQFLKKNLGNYRYATVGTDKIPFSSTSDIRTQKELQNLLPPSFNLFYELPSNRSHPGPPIKSADEIASLALNTEKVADEDVLLLSKAEEKRLTLQSVKYFLSLWPIKSPNFKPVKEIFLPKDLMGMGKKKIYIYENKRVLPRAFFVSEAVIFDQNSPLEEKQIYISSSKFDPFSTVFLEADLSGPNKYKQVISKDPKSYIPAEFIEDSSHKIALKIQAPDDGFLVLNDTYYPNWRASVNGKRARIYRANYNFRAVPVKKGENKVEFSYYPKSFYQGLKISVLTLLFLLFFTYRRVGENQFSLHKGEL